MMKAITREQSPLAKSFAALLSAQVSARAIRLLYVVAIGRMLGPEQLGIYAYGVAMYTALLVVGNFGQRLFLSVRIARQPGKSDLIASQSLILRLCATAVAVLLGTAVLWTHRGEGLIFQALAILLVALVARSIALWVRDYHVALEDSGWLPRYEIGFRGGEAVVGIGLLASGVGLLPLCVLHSLIWSLEALFAFRRLTPRVRLRLRKRMFGRSIWRYAGISAIFVASLGVLNLFPRIGIVALGQMSVDVSNIGQLSIAIQAVLAFVLLAATFGNALVPAIGRLKRGGKAGDVAKVASLMKVILVLGALMAIVVEAYGAPVALLALGEEFVPAVHMMTWLVWVLGPYAAVVIAIQALNALSGPGTSATIAIGMVASHVLLLVAMLPLGASAAVAVSFGVIACGGSAVALYTLAERIGLDAHGWWIGPLAVTGITFAAMKLVPFPTLLFAPLAFAGVLVGVWRLKIVGFHDVEAVLLRLGIHRPRVADLREGPTPRETLQERGNPW